MEKSDEDFQKFLKYFDMDKETLKFILHETLIEIENIEEVLRLETSPELLRKYTRKLEEMKSIKLALIAVDDTAVISTLNFQDTLDINQIFQGGKRINFDFKKGH